MVGARGLDIEEIFFHCSKAFLRSALWKAETWTPEVVPPHPEISYALNSDGVTLDELRDYYGDKYVAGLYREPEG